MRSGSRVQGLGGFRLRGSGGLVVRDGRLLGLVGFLFLGFWRVSLGASKGVVTKHRGV